MIPRNPYQISNGAAGKAAQSIGNAISKGASVLATVKTAPMKKREAAAAKGAATKATAKKRLADRDFSVESARQRTAAVHEVRTAAAAAQADIRTKAVQKQQAAIRKTARAKAATKAAATTTKTKPTATTSKKGTK